MFLSNIPSLHALCISLSPMYLFYFFISFVVNKSMISFVSDSVRPVSLCSFKILRCGDYFLFYFRFRLNVRIRIDKL